ncbi:NACHT domain-containing protein [Phormidium tenue]|uniref:NACHT domain-containing protein n=1 Tax=Phormidium tenue FACHB-1050 TaxID=2692857 RepID=A0ABR8CEV9_9CYAN|nr:NACHT domain-containing protein [Phormidium tenue]MBD2319338.1 NACHT domain-containing protein [Phormidium tenue FACHB-1050]
MNQFGKFAEKIGILVQGGTVNVGQIRLDSEMSRQELRNRKALLNNVRTAWVEGVLEKSLHEQISIVLGLENRPSAVASPWNLDLINPDKSCQPLPAGTPAIDVFDKLGEGGTLLILGEPGSGKTITLLQLARDLITRAEEEIDRRIPVVLNLSSWAAEKQTIAKWIVEELNSKYQVNRKIGQMWVENQELLLLLDGLDEIRDLEKRNACMTALNFFQQEQATEMVVCCRVRDYAEMGHQLKLQSALVLQPLTADQIRNYLDRLQFNLTLLKTLLIEDETLQELAQSPLLLNIMVLAYQGIEFADIPVSTIASNRKKQLFDDYINRIFQGSRPKAYHPSYKSQAKQAYSRQYVTRWLICISQQMVRYSQTIFLIEKIQPDWWIQGKDRNLIPYFVMSFLITALFLGSLSEWGSWGGGYRFFSQLGDWLSALFWWAITIKFLTSDIKPVETVVWNWKEFKTNFIKWLSICLTGGLIGGLLCGSIGIYFVVGRFGLIGGFNIGFIPWFITSLLFGSILGLILGLSIGLNKGLIGSEVEVKIYPNQSIRKSAIRALAYGLVSVIISLILEALISEEFPRKFAQLVVILVSVLRFGGQAVLQHFTLRLILYFKGFIPWNYAKFLDWASDKLFLQKVGGGYIFIHRSLMEHFAEMENG